MITVTFWPSRRARYGHLVTGPWSKFVKELIEDPEEASVKEALPGWSPATFENNRRLKNNVVAVHALVLDIDQGVRLTDLRQQWRGVLGVVHSTWSHTTKTPRWRVVTELNRSVTPKEYDSLWLWAQNRCPYVDTAARDASRFWYVPARKPGGPYVVERLKGKPLNVDKALAQAATLPKPRLRWARPSSVSSMSSERGAKPQQSGAPGDVCRGSRLRWRRPDVSASGRDSQLAIRLVQSGASDDEIWKALEKGARRKHNPPYYLAHTIAWAHHFHEGSLVRAVVKKASFESFGATPFKDALARWKFHLGTVDGELLYAEVVMPSVGNESAAEAFRAVFPTVKWGEDLMSAEGWRARGLLPLRGKALDVAVRGGRVRWLAAARKWGSQDE